MKQLTLNNRASHQVEDLKHILLAEIVWCLLRTLYNSFLLRRMVTSWSRGQMSIVSVIPFQFALQQLGVNWHHPWPCLWHPECLKCTLYAQIFAFLPAWKSTIELTCKYVEPKHHGMCVSDEYRCPPIMFQFSMHTSKMLLLCPVSFQYSSCNACRARPVSFACTQPHMLLLLHLFFTKTWILP